MSKGLYIHIPFCKYICSYCDFGKKYIHKQPVEQYVNSLMNELDMYTPFTDVDSIYIGGGTPSSIGNELISILLSKINENIDMDSVGEFTFELNPDDVTDELLKILKTGGVNRLSIGAQTLNDDILKVVKRGHTGTDVLNAVTLAKQYFNNVSVDFMFNLPNQAISDIDKTLEFIKQSEINHISYYGLILEENTIISTQNHKYLTEDEESEMYLYIQSELVKLGFENYEISNYSKAGYKSTHNFHYWDNDQYYGIGLSASGYLNGLRYTNTYSLKNYIDIIENNALPIVEREAIEESDILYERIMLGLRTNKYTQLPSDLITYIKGDAFLEDKFDYFEDRIRVKQEYYYISNEIIIRILERIEND